MPEFLFFPLVVAELSDFPKVDDLELVVVVPLVSLVPVVFDSPELTPAKKATELPSVLDLEPLSVWLQFVPLELPVVEDSVVDFVVVVDSCSPKFSVLVVVFSACPESWLYFFASSIF